MKSYLRFLSRNKLYTAIMAAGLIISLAFVIIMSCYVWQNLGVARRYYPDSERIMMVTGQTGVFKTSYRAMGKELLDNISEIEAATTLIYGSEMMAINNEEWLDTRLTMNVDSGFFDVFETEFIYGDKDVWDDVNNAIITRSMAERYGGEKVLGMPLFIAGYDHILTVAAVIDDFDKSIFQNCNIILNLDKCHQVSLQFRLGGSSKDFPDRNFLFAFSGKVDADACKTHDSKNEYDSKQLLQKVIQSATEKRQS